MKYGYVRVSSSGQNIDRQIKSLVEYGINEKNIYIDIISGKNFNRKNYNILLRRLKENDLLIVHELDRFGRNYNEIIENWTLITKVKKADIKVLNMPLLDTTTAKDVLGTFIADLVLQILGYTAHQEREDIKKRQREGILIAKSKGIKFGRKPIILDDEFFIIARSFNKKEITEAEALEKLKISRTTFYKYKKNIK